MSNEINFRLKIPRGITRLVETAKKGIRKRNIARLKRGLRHEKGRYSGLIDRVKGSSPLKYSVSDILNRHQTRREAEHDLIYGDRVEPPTDHYLIGRYMEIANRLLKRGAEARWEGGMEVRGDMDATLTGLEIFKWLNQSKRNSVRNKVQKAYEGAKRLSEEYQVPLSVPGDRRIAILKHSYRLAIDSYLEESNTN